MALGGYGLKTFYTFAARKERRPTAVSAILKIL